MRGRFYSFHYGISRGLGRFCHNSVRILANNTRFHCINRWNFVRFVLVLPPFRLEHKQFSWTGFAAKFRNMLICLIKLHIIVAFLPCCPAVRDEFRPLGISMACVRRSWGGNLLCGLPTRTSSLFLPWMVVGAHVDVSMEVLMQYYMFIYVWSKYSHSMHANSSC